MSELAFNRAILEKNNQTLAILTLALMGVNIALFVAFLFSVNKPPLMVFQKDQHIVSLESEDYKLNEAILKSFARMIARDYLSFSPTSLPKQIDGISQYLANQPTESILNSYNKNKERIEEKQVFQQFTIDGVEITRKKNPFIVELKGIKTTYVNGNNKSNEAIYDFEIKKIKPTENNPYGLIITQVAEQEPEVKEVEK